MLIEYQQFPKILHDSDEMKPGKFWKYLQYIQCRHLLAISTIEDMRSLDLAYLSV